MTANRTEKTLRKLAADLVAGHAAADAAEDELSGPGRRGDEVPAQLADPRSRAGRIAAALAELAAGREAAEAAARARDEAYLAAAAGGHKIGHVPAAVAVQAARARLERARAAQQGRIDAWQRLRDAGGRWGAGGARTPPSPAGGYYRVRDAAAALAGAGARAAGAQRKAAAAAGHQPVRNVTDIDSRLMPVRGGGFLQGYNAQNVTSEDGLIIATRLTNDTSDAPWYEPVIGDACAAAALITANQPAPPAGPGDGENAGDAAGHGDAASDSDGEGGTDGHGDGSGIGLVLADAGYLSKDNLQAEGPDRLIATGKRRKPGKAAREAAGEDEPGGQEPGEGNEEPGGALIAAMTARLATGEGITAYRQRGHIAETPHASIKHNKRFRQLWGAAKPKPKPNGPSPPPPATCSRPSPAATSPHKPSPA